jgi:protein SCO1/2
MTMKAHTASNWLLRSGSSLALVLMLGLSGCGKDPAALGQETSPAKAEVNTYPVKGVVKELLPGGASVKIRHEAIPGYMEAMTMPFDVKHTNELTKLKPGDVVKFNLVVTPDDGWIEKIEVIGYQPPPVEPIRVVPDVEPLQVGDALPDYPLITEGGAPIRLSAFKGRALALTFIFTRCPFPDFCPRTSKQFAETFKQMSTLSGGPTNWHLLCVSFDVKHDTPAVLKAYAQLYQADPTRWNFLTGNQTDIDALTEQFGLLVTRSEAGFDHNLRTVVINANGKIQRIFQGNKWEPDELVTELAKAARP